MTVHERTVPRPLTVTNSHAGAPVPQWGHRTSGGSTSFVHAAQRATLSTCWAALAQYAADVASGTGTGRVTV